jgi:hypothetical protein
MTFDQIVDKVMQKLNLTSADAKARIGERVNELYRTVTTSIGLQTSRLKEKEVSLDPTAVGSTLPYVTVVGLEKVFTVRLHIAGQRPKLLNMLAYDDIKSTQSDSVPNQNPLNWAEFRVGANTVTILLDAFPSTQAFILEFEGLEIADTLSGSMTPAFPESFHDLLVEGAKAEELYKMEKPSLAQMAEEKFKQRMSDLRYFLAKSQWMDVVQGQLKKRHFRGFSVIND